MDSHNNHQRPAAARAQRGSPAPSPGTGARSSSTVRSCGIAAAFGRRCMLEQDALIKHTHPALLRGNHSDHSPPPSRAQSDTSTVCSAVMPAGAVTMSLPTASSSCMRAALLGGNQQPLFASASSSGLVALSAGGTIQMWSFHHGDLRARTDSTRCSNLECQPQPAAFRRPCYRAPGAPAGNDGLHTNAGAGSASHLQSRPQLRRNGAVR